MNQGRDISLWAAVAAFFASLLAIGIFDIIDTDLWTEYLGALIVAGITGGAVYAQQRLSFARKASGERPDHENPDLDTRKPLPHEKP